jgi:superfamily II DNA or RNA helicase
MAEAFILLLSTCSAALGIFTLRNYQQRVLATLSEVLEGGARSVLLCSPTGSGKSTIAAGLVRCALDAGMRVLFIAHRRELINQAYDRFAAAGIDRKQLGVIMGSDTRWNPGAAVQIASVDTLRHRRLPAANMVLADECHRATSTGFRSIQEHYKDAFKIGLTATPFRADGTPLGDVYSELVVVASMKELIAQGALVEPRCFTVPPDQRPDLSKVKVRRGDYDERELADAMDRSPLIGNLVEHWRKHADGVATIVFATSVAHSQHITERFREAGIAVEHLDGNTETPERDAILKRLASGDTQVVSSVNCLAEGLDIPRVKCAILARPTKSLGLYMQQAGRILRPYQGQPAIILDHAGCVLEHGLPQQDREYSLKPKPKRDKGPTEPPPARECPGCSALLPIQTRTCPFCDESLLAVREAPTEAEGELVEVNEQSPELRIAHWKHLCGVATRHGLNPRWILHKYRDRFGEEPPADFALPGWKPKTDEQKHKYLQTLLANEPSARWARVRYRAELGEKAPQ